MKGQVTKAENTGLKKLTKIMMKHTYLPVEAVIDSVLPTRRW